ncbi:serine/threonine dehydratase [Sulfitobacter aestuariivivens]|uniref:Serine/threonine dehydratase n=1 Tax=Sulfitobacter aestuariivivens TaxID=2766981 RepID=A0A927D557_9RHOB|nr:serine/threonine dehydratase [Sulfitobacter aestuariivivens]MBD3663632.1 serine/threonine dehydratase [Sulfitobacter aestuariivivens]
MIGRAEITAASDRVRSHIRRTPVLSLETGALGLDHPLKLKLEHTQITGSFKVRGAFNSLMGADLPAAGAVAISGGNHGAAVAYAATSLGAKSTVFVPAQIAKEVKLARMRHFGAEVIVTEGNVDDAVRAYANYAKETGALAVHPYDSPGTITGQGTLALEMDAQLNGIDTVLVAVGGGGLIGGVAAWFGGHAKVVAVETKLTSTLDQTLKGTLSPNFSASGISASGLGASSIGDLNIDLIRAHVAENVVVADADVIEAGRRLWGATRMVCEPGGVTALAALTSGGYVPAKDERVAVVICGGNAEPNWFEGDAV